MRVLVVHNRYQQPGGEDVVMERESRLLRDHGHEVVTYIRSNDELRERSWWGRPKSPIDAIWAADSYRQIQSILREVRPDVVHFHNTFAMISPAAYYACRRAGVPVVQSLHNPRLICPSANLCRNGEVCEQCVGRTFAWPGIVHSCYRSSALQTAAVAAVTGLHRMAGTWDRSIDRYIVFTEFYRQKFSGAGLPARKLVVKPHFVDPDPGPRPDGEDGSYALFIGRLDPEKGAMVMIDAWRSLSDIPLVVRGGGKLLPAVVEGIGNGTLRSVRTAPRMDDAELMSTLKRAKVLIWPSQGHYETFGLVAIEAFACGVPVIAARIGVAGEIVEHMHTGLHFEPGSPADLADKVRWAFAHPEEMARMGRNARYVFEDRYTAAKNYEQLVQIYGEVCPRIMLQPSLSGGASLEAERVSA
jgi:glycosyltransferase involved in cell wall biosynthesis